MSPRSRSTHLPRRPVTGTTVDPRPSSSVSAADSLFALLRRRSTRGDFSTFSARFRHDAVQHLARQPRSAAGGSEGFHAAEGTGRALKSTSIARRLALPWAMTTVARRPCRSWRGFPAAPVSGSRAAGRTADLRSARVSDRRSRSSVWWSDSMRSTPAQSVLPKTL